MARYFGTNLISGDSPTYTQAQLDAINSNITSTLVTKYNNHINNDDIHVTTTDKSNWDDAVHKSGNEIITGEKTFSGGNVTRFKDSTNTIGTYQERTRSTSCLYFQDANNVRLGRIQPNYAPGTNLVEMGIYASNGMVDENAITIRNDGYTHAPTPEAANSTGDTRIATTGWVSDATKSTNVVHRDSTETITGQKNFTNSIRILDNSGGNILLNKNGAIELTANSDINSGAYIDFHYNESTEDYTSRIIEQDNGLNYVKAGGIPATNSKTSSSLVTAGWVNDPNKSTNVVHRDFTETITGFKTFNNTGFDIKNSNMDINTNPTDTIYGGILFADKNGKRIGKIETYNFDSGEKSTYGNTNVAIGISASRYFGETIKYSSITLYLNDSQQSCCNMPMHVYGTNFHGTADYAKWADLAERYKSDNNYKIGTLIKFGGEKDITIADNKCNGVISDKPGFVLDSELEDSQLVALVGKTPIRVIGKINKFDNITLSEVPGIARVAKEGEKVIAKALENSDIEEEKLILCVTKFNLD